MRWADAAGRRGSFGQLAEECYSLRPGATRPAPAFDAYPTTLPAGLTFRASREGVLSTHVAGPRRVRPSWGVLSRDPAGSVRRGEFCRSPRCDRTPLYGWGLRQNSPRRHPPLADCDRPPYGGTHPWPAATNLLCTDALYLHKHTFSQVDELYFHPRRRGLSRPIRGGEVCRGPTVRFEKDPPPTWDDGSE